MVPLGLTHNLNFRIAFLQDNDALSVIGYAYPQRGNQPKNKGSYTWPQGLAQAVRKDEELICPKF